MKGLKLYHLVKGKQSDIKIGKRLCIRAEDITRQVAIAMKKEVLNVLPELEDKLVPYCQYWMWCLSW